MKRRIALFLSMIIAVASFSSYASAAESVSDEQIVMPDLGIAPTVVSQETADEIDAILQKMNDLAVSSSQVAKNKMRSGQDAKLSSINQEYDNLKEQAAALGCVFLTDEQALKYVYNGELPEATTRASISYPNVSGINFAITYYTYNGNSMAKCVATQKPNQESKLVKNYDTVEMYKDTKISDLFGKGVQMTATKLVNYALGKLENKKVTFAVNVLSKLPGTVYPSSSSSSKAKLSLAVSTNSTVVHIWRLMNGQYYFRTASVKAAINETWVLRDVNGKHYTKTHSYTSYSDYYDDSQQAITVSSQQSYGIYQQYKTQGLFGIYFQKQEVSPFTAALPIHFA